MNTGLFKSLIAFFNKVSKLLNVHTAAIEDVSSTLFDLCNSGIDLLPIA